MNIVTLGLGADKGFLLTLGLGAFAQPQPHPSGGWIKTPIRDEADIRRQREDHPLWPKAQEVIAAVAQRQAEDLHLDEQQRLEELSRELQLAGIEWEARYLSALNDRREQLLNQELAYRVQLQQANQDTLLLLMAAAV